MLTIFPLEPPEATTAKTKTDDDNNNADDDDSDGVCRLGIPGPRVNILEGWKPSR